MSSQLLEIQPHRELKFIFELKKQSCCVVRLINKTDQHVAFKVKTTSPKKYCVRPNVGLLLPREICEFTVTMQAQKMAPPDIICKDKFLIQSTTVPPGTMEEDVTSNMFSKESGRYIEETKLKVTLISQQPSPELSPINGNLNAETYENSVDNSQLPNNIEEIAPNQVVVEHIEKSAVKTKEELKPLAPVQFDHPWDDRHVAFEPTKDEEFERTQDVVFEPPKGVAFEHTKGVAFEPSKDVQFHTVKEMNAKPTVDVETVTGFTVEVKTIKDMLDRTHTEDVVDIMSHNNVETKPAMDTGYRIMNNGAELRLQKDVEEMKSKLHQLESKLSKAERTIVNLTEERRSTIKESENLRQELASLKVNKPGKRVQVGYPFLFVCMVAFLSIVLGHYMHR